jgi:hypothetical protein
MSKKLSALTKITRLLEGALIYIVDLTRPAGDQSVGITKDDFANELGEATGIPTVVSAIWTSGLTFFVTADSLYLDNVLYSATADDVTLDAAHATLERLDYLGFYVSTGLVGKATGTPAAANVVVEPDYDPSDFYPIKLVLIKPAATEPSDPDPDDPGTGTGMARVLVFDEGVGSPTEFDVTLTADGAINSNDPFSGTESIEVTNVAVGSLITFVSGSKLNTKDFTAISWWTKLKGDMTGRYIRVRFLNGSLRVGRPYYFKTEQHGFNSANTNYQKIVIDKSDFSRLPDTVEYDTITIKYQASGFSGYFFDLFQLHDGSGTTDQGDGTLLSNEVFTDTSNFDGNLSDADDTVQKALDTLDELVLGLGDMILASVQIVTGLKTFDALKLGMRNVADTFTSVFTNVNTAARTYTLPDASGTIALTSDINGELIGFAFSDETTDLAVGTSAVSFQMPNFATTLTDVSVNVVTAPTGSTAIFDINEAGVSVLSTKISIDAGEKTSEDAATPPVISDSSIAANAIMTVDIDQVGSTITGAGGKVWIYFTRT